MESFIRGDSRIVCLIGYPVAHSISPVIHNHAFRELGLPYCYIPLAVPHGAVHKAAALFRASRFAGANITIPHKSAITHYCDRLSALSTITGTVNTLYWDGDTLCGTTTDPEGFKRAVEAAGHPIRGSRVVILGNGGTARTLAVALALDRDIASLCIVGRNSGRISALADEVKRCTGFDVSHAQFGSDSLHGILEQCSLLVNTTNVGMHPDTASTPLPKEYFNPAMMVFDAIYNPSRTRFLREAAERGCRTENGLRMLLFQGLASFRYWTGTTAPEELFPIQQLQTFVERR